MLCPNFMFGLSRNVKKETNKYVTKLKANLNNFDIPKEKMFEIDPGKHRFRFFKGTTYNEGIYVYWLFEEIIRRTRDSVFVSKCFYEALKYPWSILCLFGGFMSWTQSIFHEDREKLIPFLKAVNKYWNDYLKLGDIFIDVGASGNKNIWTVGSNLKKVLALLGVSNERLLDKTIPYDLMKLI